MSGQSIVPILDHLDLTDQNTIVDLSRCCHLAVQHESSVLLSARLPINSALAEVVGPLCDLRIELPLWTPEETYLFVSHLMRGAGLPHMAIDAIDTIHTCSGGRMRDTVQVLRLSVFAARAQKADTIDAELVRTVAAEIWQPAPQQRRNGSVLPPSAALATARD
jgi:hypothetical protein